jgi:hypothetical protein
MLPLGFLSKTRAAHWILAAAAILLVGYLTGPFIQFPILFVLPVALATATHEPRAGAGVAVILPLLRLSFFLKWGLPSSWMLEAIDTAVDVAKPTFASGFKRQTDSSQDPGNAKASTLTLLADTPKPKKALSAVRPNGRSGTICKLSIRDAGDSSGGM